MPLADSTILMILPALLVVVGMLTGYCFWGWLRGIDQTTVDELHDEIRGLGRQIDRNKTEAADLQDLHFENQELRSLAGSFEEKQQLLNMEIQELNSQMEVRSTELQMAESTITQLRIQVAQLEAAKTTAQVAAKNAAQAAASSAAQAAALNAAQAAAANASKPTEKPETLSINHTAAESNSVETQNAQQLNKTNTEDRKVSKPMILRMEPTEQPANVEQPSLDIEYGGEVISDENLGLVYSRPPMFNDNLQLISGIASKLENQLNEYGVYTFQQIMLWSKKNIDQFSSLLDTFQDRIERDDWVGQASALYSKAQKMRKAA